MTGTGFAAEAVTALDSHVRTRLVQALESEMLPLPCTEAAARSVLGVGGAEAAEIVAAVSGFEQLGLTGRQAAAWLRSLEAAVSRTPRPDLVWSGPTVPGVHARATRQVYEELLAAAERSLFVSTYVYHDGSGAFDLIARRMEAVPDLDVMLLLNIGRPWGDTTAPDEVTRRFAERFWTRHWEGHRKPRVYFDPRALEVDQPAGVLHAKAVVVDDQVVFVTSANLTEAAFDRNVELGLLHRDRALALAVSSHFRKLVETGRLVRLPGGE